MPKYIPLQRNFSLFTPPSNHYETHWDALWDTETNSNKLEWDQLLERNKVVILAEAGTGKTEELKAVANRLYQEGKASFFCRIETLLDLSFEDSLDIGDVQRFTQWQNAEVDLAYFFLDSVDEAKL